MRAIIRAAKHRLAMGADEPDDDLAIARLIFAENRNRDPSAELLGSLSPGAISRRRDKLQAEAVAEVEAKRAASPAGKIAQAKLDREAREQRRELVELAAEQVGWAPADVAEHGEDAVLRAAGFQETRFEDLGEGDLEAQAAWLEAHPEEAASMQAEEEFRSLAGRWPGMTGDERAHAAAHAGASSIAEVEAELVKRGRGDSFVPISGEPAAEETFARESEIAKGGGDNG